MLSTAKGKPAALKALAARRKANKARAPIDNGAAYAGSPMYFDCDGCGAPIQHPEDYLTRIRLCAECQALKDLGWLE
jgi:hypothetical protein